ncbi:MAG: hypothetical protein MHM6MM_001555 [Cercozoa sp. M6MM]
MSQVPEGQACVGPQSEAAGKAASCEGCPNQSACASGQMRAASDATSAAITAALSQVKHKLLVLSGKGGVGKSTFAAQLAYALALRQGRRVGVLDIDICGPSAPRLLGCETMPVHRSGGGLWTPVSPAVGRDRLSVMSVGFLLQNRTDAVIWRGPRKTGLIRQFLSDVLWEQQDYLVVDTPPGTSDEHISAAQFLGHSADGAILVTTPQEVALLDVRKEITFCRKSGIKVLGVVENMAGFVCPCCNHETDVFTPSTGGAEAMCKEMNVPFLGRLPLDRHLVRCSELGLPLVEEAPDSAACKALLDIVEKIHECTPALAETFALPKDAFSDEEEDSSDEDMG